MAIMQMRVAQVQRAKVHQDRQLLLALPGAPKVDYFGRKLPGQENPGMFNLIGASPSILSCS